MNGPLVSVIVPVCNVEHYLEACVSSLRRQTYRRLEIILVDDGSVDSSGQMCDRFQLEDLRIQVIHKENGGLSSARNAGLDAAKGTYLCFVDSDDWVSETMLEETVDLMERYGYDQCVWGMNLVEPGGEVYYKGRRKPLTLHFPSDKQKQKVLCRWLLTYRLDWTVCSRVFRREIIARNRLRFEDERRIGAEDLDFSFRYLACCQSLHYIPKAFYFYRQRPGSIMNTSTLQARTVCMLRMIRWEEQLLSEQPLFQFFYIYSGVMLVTFAGNFLWNQPVPQGLAQMFSYLCRPEDREYLREQADRARRNHASIYRTCGLRLGGRVCAFYQYILNQNPGPFCRWEQIQRGYETLRDVRTRLWKK